MHFVYILRCGDGSLYTGCARDPAARAAVHNRGRGAKYTRSRLPVAIVYTEGHESLSAALRREGEIKRWPRIRKERLIDNGNNGDSPRFRGK